MSQHTYTTCKGLLQIRNRRVFIAKVRRDGHRDGRTELQFSEYHTKRLQMVGKEALVKQALNDGYQVSYTRGA